MGKATKGQCKNISEVIRVGFRLLEEENRGATVKETIQDGINSGIAKNFDPKKHLENLKAGRRKNTKYFLARR
ncbi:ribbon-helix-helix domain-containing protein [Pinibacter aurantiacus]|uniref:Type II toxin-antitoxin system ParD family antitoxin n=1 Tax=Pinibacter aurantiacus TaxID=2851599 RepID=A0A9E2SDZ6_9BACT|nr:type II toxin-antitoxin system ParD family antitoxin [Pinibacter aurantiacus]MBV4359934.1 type II toxin-antitoxin system ParD family antitoxin [Pinibacter aurantiacus]